MLINYNDFAVFDYIDKIVAHATTYGYIAHRGQGDGISRKVVYLNHKKGVKIRVTALDMNRVGRKEKSLEVRYATTDHTGRYRHQNPNHRTSVRDNKPLELHHIDSIDSYIDSICLIVDKLEGAVITSPRLRSKSDLANHPPFRFTATPTKTVRLARTKMPLDEVAIQAVFCACHASSIVTINDNLSLNHEAAKPEEPWFYIKGTRLDGQAGPSVIVRIDGDDLVFYPVVFNRVSNELKRPNFHTDFSMMSPIDEMLIRGAITSYLSFNNLS